MDYLADPGVANAAEENEPQVSCGALLIMFQL